MPVSWNGAHPLKLIDALFTSVSAVCVTGLITVDTAIYSKFGQIVILYLIEAGGLGIITFSTLYLILPRSKISFESRKMIQSYAIAGANVHPKNIVRFIVAYTLLMEFLGFFFLFYAFRSAADTEPFFNAAFHSVSAFCNAGFSRFSEGLVPFSYNIIINITIMMLIILGGIGFMVVWDVIITSMRMKKHLEFHSRIMLIMTPILIFTGAVFFLIFEWDGALSDVNGIGYKIMGAFFQSVTTRTAGFNTIDEAALSGPSKGLTMILMFIGAGSGSTGGGIKVSTFFICMIIVLRGIDPKGDIRIFKRRLSSQDISRAAMFALKAASILVVSVFLLVVTESVYDHDFSFLEMFFECASAFGTVGLSLGITSSLSFWGKLVIIITMFAGRVGLFSMIIPQSRKEILRYVEYPDGEVLIG